MKHIDKILPLSILVATLLFIANSLNPLYIVVIDGFFMNSSTAIIGFIILSMTILTVLMLFSLIKETKFIKKYSVLTILLLMMIAVFAHAYLPNHHQYGRKKCNNEGYYLISDNAHQPWNPIGYISLFHSDDSVVFRRLGIAYDKFSHFSNGEVWYTTDYGSVENEEVRNKIKEC